MVICCQATLLDKNEIEDATQIINVGRTIAYRVIFKYLFIYIFCVGGETRNLTLLDFPNKFVFPFSCFRKFRSLISYVD